jgi:hypothetical protein
MSAARKKTVARRSSLLLTLVASLALITQAPSADPFTEPAFFDGQVVHFLLPSASSDNHNEQIVADCFRVGPQVPLNVPVRAKAYILMIPGASQETHCSTDGRPAGPLTHNHVLSAAPGSLDYNAKFQLVVIHPGPNYPGAAFADTFNSEAAVLTGLLNGDLVVVIPDAAHVNWSVKLTP